MPRTTTTVAAKRNYAVKTVAEAKAIGAAWLKDAKITGATFGLPEIDDRHHVWRVPINDRAGVRAGEIVIDAKRGAVSAAKSTRPALIAKRLDRAGGTAPKKKRAGARRPARSPLCNTVAIGDCRELLATLPPSSVDLVFTSPPYFNARPEYTEYEAYEHYLEFMREVIRACGRVLAEGRFFAMNSSPVLLRRASRNEASRRIAVPFDLHRLFIEEGFEFIDDIIWLKPEGAGWATGRGRRFAADRSPLQYKAVPVTEYVMVYRKRTDRLIDWHIRNHHDASLVESSRIGDDYERTNVWKIQPNTRSEHPAPFPLELAERIVKYYSFKDDVVLDPFAGSGTTGAAAAKLARRFVMTELNPEYAPLLRRACEASLGDAAERVRWIGAEPGKGRGVTSSVS